MPNVDRIPNIGLTLDWQPPGGFSSYPWYACRQNYVDRITAAGGIAWLIPLERERIDAYLDRIDGLMVTSGPFDVDPSYYRCPTRHAATVTKERRTAFEHGLMRGALDRDLPLLGIGGGHQLLNVVLGGSLLQHIPDDVANPVGHEQTNPRTEPGHRVDIVAGTRLHRISQTLALDVNSDHHQAVATVGPGVVVSATAADGVIEAIEAPDHRFVMGVQWAPEFALSAADAALFEAFLEACRGAA